LITARDMALGLSGRASPRLAQPIVAPALAVPFKERLLLAVLYLTVLASSVAFIEPSPHDGLIFVLATAALVAGVRFDRVLALPLILFLIWDFAALMSLINVIGEEKATQSAFTTVYLTVAAVLWACLFSQNPLPRLVTLRAAYIATAVLTTLAGLSGYFRLFPGAFDLFVQNGRAMGTFKDPNVFGPFLIWPALVIMERMMARAIRFFDIALFAELFARRMVSFRAIGGRHDRARYCHGAEQRGTHSHFHAGRDRRGTARRAAGDFAVVRFHRHVLSGTRASAAILRHRLDGTLPKAGMGHRISAEISKRHGAVRLLNHLRPAAAQRLS
jgi:hypothetical protein